MADRAIENPDAQVPEIPEILEDVLLCALEEAREKMASGKQVVPFTVLAVKDSLFIENYPAASTEECFEQARKIIEAACGACAYALCYDGYLGDGDALLAEGGVPGDASGYTVGYLYRTQKDTITFDDDPVYVGSSCNFMKDLKEPECYSDQEINSQYLEEPPEE